MTRFDDAPGRARRYIRSPRSQFSENLKLASLSYNRKGDFAMFKYALMAGAVALLAGAAVIIVALRLRRRTVTDSSQSAAPRAQR